MPENDKEPEDTSPAIVIVRFYLKQTLLIAIIEGGYFQLNQKHNSPQLELVHWHSCLKIQIKRNIFRSEMSSHCCHFRELTFAICQLARHIMLASLPGIASIA